VTTVSALKQAIADAEDELSEDVFVPEWNVTLQVRSLSGHARASIVEQLQGADGASFSTFYPELVIESTYDPDTGEKVFNNDEADRNLILSKNAKALDRVAKKAMQMSGLAEESEGEVGKPS
jgi:hypothetical protein